MKIRKKYFFVVGFSFLLHLPLFGMEIHEVVKEGKKIIEIENEMYKVVLVPEIARLPLSYLFKTTGHEMFIHPAPLSTPNVGFQYYGGIIDSIPWVSGKVGDMRLPDKGYLYSVPWEYKIKKRKNTVSFTGKTSFSYQDPVSGEESHLFFQKIIIGYEGTSRLKMNYLIKNIGRTNAKFTFSAHSRTGVAQYDRGDYFYAPGKECFVYYMANMPHLEEAGIHPPCWTKWPLKEATEFFPEENNYNIHVILPANWCVVGDEKYQECLFFIASPIEIPGGKDIMKMGIFMTNAGYVVEPCLTYSIVGNPEEWKIPESTVLLKPGQECKFSIDLVVYQGISKKEIPDVYAVYPECIIMDKPVLVRDSNRTFLKGRVLFPGEGNLVIKTGGAILTQQKITPGIFNLNQEIKTKKKDKITLYLYTPSGVRQIGVVKEE